MSPGEIGGLHCGRMKQARGLLDSMPAGFRAAVTHDLLAARALAM